MLKPYIALAIKRQDLTAEQAEAAMHLIMTGQATPAQIGAYLIALRMKGETIDEIAGSARAMRGVAVPVSVDLGGRAVYDTCGTGGDGAGTFNISTAAAFVVAGAGRTVAKHGNRAASSQCGSADVLAALGLNLDLTPEQVSQALDEVGIAFFFAPKFHPAMRHAIGPRKEIGQRTIFNVLGPLNNPAGANVQVVGVYDPALTEPLARVLGELGSRAAFVIHGHGGTDELNPGGPNRVSHLKDGAVRTFDLDPAELGFDHTSMSELQGGTPDANAALLRGILSGQVNGAQRSAVLLNAAAALAAETGDLRRAVAEARQALDSGAAVDRLEALLAYSRRVSPPPPAE
ncbi:MAG: anthranilate phosphoribosyltransferase [Anaerolineales bacterium]|nr:anthranilate phosphoribosyltransferase [Anaerolineales bacterium]